MPLQQHDQLERKEHIPDAVRTNGKDEVADWLDANVFAKDRWPVPVTQLVEEMAEDGVDYSRQHISNTLTDYYQPVPDESEHKAVKTTDHNGDSLTIEIPTEVDRQSYLRGWLDGHYAEEQ